MKTKQVLLMFSSLYLTVACGMPTSSSQLASARESVVTCNSFDSTFSPFYEVTVSAMDTTFTGSYLIEISERNSGGFPGPTTIIHRRESRGGRELVAGAGELKFRDGQLKIKRFGSGRLKGDLTFGRQTNIELVCQLSGTIQPVGGVSN